MLTMLAEQKKDQLLVMQTKLELLLKKLGQLINTEY